jgi:hypothetical protein
MSMLLTLTALMITLSACGSAGSYSNASDEQQAARTEVSSGQKHEGEGSSGQGSGRLEHPALGSAEAPVVLTEYSDYQ